jgi:hypothetical protein
MRLRGNLDTEALEKSLNEIVRRHEVLRTVFPTENGTPIQRIRPAAPVRLQRSGLGKGKTPDSEQAVLKTAAASIQRSFDVAGESLLRAQLLELGETDHVLFLAMHELVGDAQSPSLILQELSRLWKTVAIA